MQCPPSSSANAKVNLRASKSSICFSEGMGVSHCTHTSAWATLWRVRETGRKSWEKAKDRSTVQMFSKKHKNNSLGQHFLFFPPLFCVSLEHEHSVPAWTRCSSRIQDDDPRVWDLGGMHHCRASMILPNEARRAPVKEKLDGTVMRGSWSPVASLGLTWWLA